MCKQAINSHWRLLGSLVSRMGVCTGCGLNFVYLGGDTCMKCKKREKAKTPVEQEQVERQPQCQKCSVVFPFLKATTCGACESREDSNVPKVKGISEAEKASANVAAQELLMRSRASLKDASQLRLHQPVRTLNPGLTAAAAKKETLAALRKTTRADAITVETSLFYFPPGPGSSAKKDQKRWPLATSTADVLKLSKETVENNYVNSPPLLRGDACVLNFEDVSFGVARGASSVYHFQPTTEQFRGSIEDTFNTLKTEGKLSDADIKNRNISLRLYAYVVAHDSDLDTEERGSLSSVRRTSARPSLAAGTKRKAANSISIPGRSREYKSAFRPPRLPSSSPEPEVIQTEEDAYATFDFNMTTMSTDMGGTVVKTTSNDSRTIKIARGWQNDIGTEPKNGYIAKGFMKFAFLGQFEGEKYAIFQLKPDLANETQNRDDLLSELSLLTQGQYFANSFAERAKVHSVKLNAALRFNTNGAFVGQVNGKDLSDWEAQHGMDAPLKFTTFLAAPYLPARDSSLYEERKFSGTEETGFNSDIVGMVLDAFAHHVVDDSSGYHHLCDLQGIVSKSGQPKTVILFDPQGNSLSGKVYFGDRGKEAILKFLQEHKCQSLCEKLGLKKKGIPEPLQLNRAVKLMF
ncbi:hypothetical protein D9619_009979 [Psilocybe cf. subviscida]|uniref:Alpha-type protein kinase domain-containing protein n=1 Tax=Psilocybe cf. subviscida TaxID=2480587 RepID=A0A8H5F6F1_9AGAR|nr:hypothetical protein D9619_009979 [Psilocybe cf. subviscida]